MTEIQGHEEITPQETLIWYDGPVFFTLDDLREGRLRAAIWTDEDASAETLTYVVVETSQDKLDAMKDGQMSLRDFLVSQSLQRWVVVSTRGWKVLSWSEPLTADELVRMVGEAGLPDQGLMMKSPEASAGVQTASAGPMASSLSL